jgi:D-glycero-D-manno-heptose 1,7-bisphosphate phosphatase
MSGTALVHTWKAQRIDMGRRALFLDRDGTLVHPRHYPSRPDELQIFAGVPALLQRFQQQGWLIVLISNQSGVARGYFGEGELAYMHACLAADLAQQGVRLDGVYYCPHHPDGTVAPFNVACGCRKPQPGLLLRAADELQIDLPRSWFVGDILDDVEAGNRAGCRTVLVDLGTEPPPATPLRTPHAVGRSTVHALAIVAAAELGDRPAEPPYTPARWLLRSQSVGELR